MKSFSICLVAEMPLDALMKQYAGAYAEGFEWPQPSPHTDEEDMDEAEGAFRMKPSRPFSAVSEQRVPNPAVVVVSDPGMECPAGSPPEAIMIDSLLSVDQYKATSSDSDRKAARDIAEVAAATELILPKGSFRTTSSVARHHFTA